MQTTIINYYLKIGGAAHVRKQKKKKNDVTSDVSSFAADGGDEIKAITNKSFLDLSGLSRLTTLMTSFVSNYAAPKVHNHDSSYAKASHAHTIANVTGLQDQLNSKADKGSFAAASHTHTIANITNLQSQLDSKAASSHSHAWSAITGKPSTFTPASHTHTSSQVTDLKSYLLNNVFKVGYVWISYTSTSPASIIGGSWTAITGRFPYFNAGTAIGGNNTHTHTLTSAAAMIDFMWMGGQRLTMGKTNASKRWGDSGVGQPEGQRCAYSSTGISSDSFNGGYLTKICGNADTNYHMPAYQTLYAWRRTA